MTQQIHIPVLYQETLETLNPQSGGSYIDATLGDGGHSEGILDASSPDGRLLGFDASPEAIRRSKKRLARFGERFTPVHSNFRNLHQIATSHGFTQTDGILLDLGVSSNQLDDATLGFSFQDSGPLDMRLDFTQGETVAEVINRLDAEELADILYRYGEERKSRRIARAIIARRPIHSTTQLAEVISRAVGGRRGARLHPATRSFQALRIYVNDELGALETTLPQAIDLLRPGGVLAVISFHSLEDRIVKHYLRYESQDCVCPPQVPICQCDHKARINILHRKGIHPTAEEIASNPRSRSARLRAARKL